MTAELRSEVAGTRIRTWHLMPTDRMGPPPAASPPMRMTASWSGSHDPAVYKSVTRRSVPDGELPSDPQQTDKHRSGIQVCEKPVSQFIIAARAQASRRCETQAPLSGTPLSLLAFRSLDPFRALRKPDRRRRDEKRLSCSEQKTGDKLETTT